MSVSDSQLKRWGLAFLASIPIAGFLIFLCLHWLSKAMEFEKQAEIHATLSLVTAEKLSDAAEARTIASRGYLIAGSQEFLDLFAKADSDFRSRLKAMEKLADSATEEQIARTINELESEYFANIARVHQMRASMAPTAGLAQYFKDRVAPLSHRLTRTLDQLVEHERIEQAIVHHSAHASEAEWLARLRIGITIVFILIGFLGLLIWRALEKLYSRLQSSLIEKEEALATLNTVLKEAPIGIALFDSKFRYTRINLAAAEMNALPVSEHIGKSMQSVLPTIWEGVKPIFNEVLFTGVPRTGIELSAEHRKSGRLQHFLGSYHPVKSPAGRVIGVAAMFIDITDRTEADESLRRREREFREFLENAPLAVRWLDPNGTIVWANEQELKSTGYEKAEYLGHPMAKFFHDPGVALQLLDRLRSGLNVNEFRVRLKRKEGSPLPATMSIGVYREGGTISGFRCYTRFGVPLEGGLYAPVLSLASDSPFPPVVSPSKE